MKYDYAGMYKWLRTLTSTGNQMICLNKISLQTTTLQISDPGLQMSNPADDSSLKGSCRWVWDGRLWVRKPLDTNNPPHTKTGMCRKSQPVFRGFQSPCWKHLIFSRILAMSEVLSEMQDQGCGEKLFQRKAALEQKALSVSKHEIKAALKLELSLTWCRLQLKLPLNLTDRCLAFNCPWKEVTVRKAQYQKTNLWGFCRVFISSSG